MSVDCHIYLPQDARFQDICDVIGILLGQKKELKKLSSTEAYYCKVDEVESQYQLYDEKPHKNVYVEPGSNPTDVQIFITSNNLDNGQHRAFFSFEISDANMKYLSGGSTPFWWTIGKELVQFFGGYIDYNDCDSVQKDFELPRPRFRNNPENDQEWQNFEFEKYNINPIVELLDKYN